METKISKARFVTWNVIKFFDPSKNSYGPGAQVNKKLRLFVWLSYMNRGDFFTWGMADELTEIINLYKNVYIYHALLAELQNYYKCSTKQSFYENMEIVAEETLNKLRSNYTNALRLHWHPYNPKTLKESAIRAVGWTGLKNASSLCIKVMIEKVEAGAPDFWKDVT